MKLSKTHLLSNYVKLCGGLGKAPNCCKLNFKINIVSKSPFIYDYDVPYLKNSYVLVFL